jgi:hypothetical protein
VTHSNELIAYDIKLQKRLDAMQEAIKNIRTQGVSNRADIAKHDTKLEALPGMKEQIADLESAAIKQAEIPLTVTKLDRRVTNIAGRLTAVEKRIP